ncbi:MAG: beta-N-acetylhexosaminidase [Akkermansia sp.]|nr:beta-N-acetylhexosaminidase [Akkermansia sp.]
MKQLFLTLLLCMIAPSFAAEAPWTSPHSLAAEAAAPAALLPFPKSVEWREGTLPIPAPEGWTLRGAGKHKSAKAAWADFTAEHPQGQGGAVCTMAKGSCPAEGYVLTVSREGVRVEAGDDAGFFYAVQTLRQLAAGRSDIPCCIIKDAPAFAVRGLLIDCGRNFQSIESLKHQLDLASRLKVNVFQWHMTDHPAWHVESKVFPQLNDPQFRTRDAGDTYSYAQIRELCEYAAARHIRIIPELDMPGHSAAFQRAMGFSMASEQGMAALEKILDEFCAEIPQELCPVVHIGADEVRIPNAKEFVERMSRKLLSLGRTPAQWGGPRDLPVGKDSIAQRWGEGGEMVERSMNPETIHCRVYDSTIGYANLFDPALLIRRYFFMRPCGSAKGDAQKLGVIFCVWPDTRVEDKSLIPLQSAQWPGLCAMAERSWNGGKGDADKQTSVLPGRKTEAFKAYRLFEKRLSALRLSMFRGEHFPWEPECGVEWTVIPPVPSAQAESVRKQVLAGKLAPLKPIPALGGNLYFRTKPCTGCLGLFSGTKPGATAWAVTHLRAEKDGDVSLRLGFDAPARSSRRWSGVAPAGEWSACGTRIWVNGQEVKNPRTSPLAGQRTSKGDTWNSPANEVPYDNEEIWWAQEPTSLPLRKGDNVIVIEQPYVGEYQSWGVSLLPVTR